MNTDKIILEFQNISSKISTYELERNNLFLKIKAMQKENNKIRDKIKKEEDPILKSLYQSKIISNQYFIDEIHSIFSFPETHTKKES